MDNLDSMGIGKALELFPDQIKTGFKQAFSANISEFHPKAIVISGMGGSSNAAKMLEGIYEEDFSTPFDIDIHNDYDLPSWVDSETLVIANSYSGSTEETLSSLEAAKKAGARVVGISTGGKLNDVVISPELTNPAGFPKSGLGISFGALTGVLARIGVLKITENEILGSCQELSEIRKAWNVKDVAKWLDGYLPVLLGGRPLIGALNAGRNAMCEISRNFTQFYDFPEMNHVLIEATQRPEAAKRMRYLFFISKFNHSRVLTRYKVTARIFTEQGLTFDNYTLKGSTKLVQALELAHYCAWVGFHLSLLQNTDPGPEPWILKLKQALS